MLFEQIFVHCIHYFVFWASKKFGLVGNHSVVVFVFVLQKDPMREKTTLKYLNSLTFSVTKSS